MKYRYDIVIAGWIGLKHTIDNASTREEELGHRYPKHFFRKCNEHRNNLISQADISNVITEEKLIPLGEGGLYEGLWNVSVELKKGFRINRYDIPLMQETVEVAESLDVNPYEIDSKGSYLIICEDGVDVVNRLIDKSIPAKIVGFVTKELAKQIIRDDDIQCLDKPRKD